MTRNTALRKSFQSTRPRRARLCLANSLSLYEKFQSTRPRRARLGRCYPHHLADCFNPRAREGRDDDLKSGCDYRRFQSTRPRRARRLHGKVLFALPMFQSTRPRRARHLRRNSISGPSLFQSTRPRRARQPVKEIDHHDKCFNPRAREGCDRPARVIFIARLVSIHAPAKGATAYDEKYGAPKIVSIHAPAKGATSACWDMVPSARVSIHAPAKGATDEAAT